MFGYADYYLLDKLNCDPQWKGASDELAPKVIDGVRKSRLSGFAELAKKSASRPSIL